MAGILLVPGAGMAVRLRGHDQPPVLLGHSLGGLVVQKYLEAGPAQGALLLAPIPRGGTMGRSPAWPSAIPR